MEQGSDDEARRGSTPPYISLVSLKTLLGDFKQHGVPGRIDRSVLTRFSGGVGGQIITALRFLHLIDDTGAPTSALRPLTSSFGTDLWPTELAKIIKESYGSIFQLNLETASPGQFNETFRKAYPSKEETFRKCVSFFLGACREAQIPVSAYLLKGTKPRAAPTQKRPRSANKKDNGEANVGARDAPPETKFSDASSQPERSNGQNAHKEAPASTGKSQSQVLLDMLNPSKMDEDEIKAVWTLILYLKKAETEAETRNNEG